MNEWMIWKAMALSYGSLLAKQAVIWEDIIVSIQTHKNSNALTALNWKFANSKFNSKRYYLIHTIREGAKIRPKQFIPRAHNYRRFLKEEFPTFHYHHYEWSSQKPLTAKWLHCLEIQFFSMFWEFINERSEIMDTTLQSLTIIFLKNGEGGGSKENSLTRTTLKAFFLLVVKAGKFSLSLPLLLVTE